MCIYIYLNVSQYDNTLFLLTLFYHVSNSDLFVAKCSGTLHGHRSSLYDSLISPIKTNLIWKKYSEESLNHINVRPVLCQLCNGEIYVKLNRQTVFLKILKSGGNYLSSVEAYFLYVIYALSGITKYDNLVLVYGCRRLYLGIIKCIVIGTKTHSFHLEGEMQNTPPALFKQICGWTIGFSWAAIRSV